MKHILFPDSKKTHPYSSREIENIKQMDKDYIWHPFTQMKDWQNEEPLVIIKGEGNYLYSIEGKKYLDGISSLWVNVFGYSQDKLKEYITKQMELLLHSTMLGQSSVPAILLAKELISLMPENLKKVFYSDNGSTATEVAIKMSYQYCLQKNKIEKKKFITFTGAYHGDSIGSVSVGGMDLFHSKYSALLFDTVKIPFPHCYRCPYEKQKESCNNYCFQKTSETISEEAKNSAALICEPMVQGADGIKTMPALYLKHLEQECKKNDLIFICDEVATGFGKTGLMFAFEQENIKPDIVCLAKGLSGGNLPLAATVVSEEIYSAFYDNYESFKTFFHGHSFTGNQMACTAALATLEQFKDNKFWESFQSNLKYYNSLLKEHIENLSCVGEVRRIGVMTGIEIVKNKATKEIFKVEEKIPQKIVEQARELGLIIRPLGNVIVLMPSLSFSKEELKELVSKTKQAIQKVLA